jgi:hypothetical protein
MFQVKTNFRKPAAIIACLAVVMLSGCGKDDGKDGESSIVGLWHFVNATADIENKENPDLVEEEKDMLAFFTVFLQGTTIEFKADKTFVMTVGGSSEDSDGEPLKGTYVSDGNRFTMTVDGESVNSDDASIKSGDYVTIENGVLTLSGNQDLDEKMDGFSSGDETYREAGFTKYVLKMNFKK